jgi:hypothetical protein
MVKNFYPTGCSVSNYFLWLKFFHEEKPDRSQEFNRRSRKEGEVFTEKDKKFLLKGKKF